MFNKLARDLRAAQERDPAARNRWEIVLLYPGLHAVWCHRFAHGLWVRNVRFLARALSQWARWATGIEIHPGATIAPGFFIDHGMGVVIGETTVIGEEVTLYQGVTLGGTSLLKGKRHPTLEDRVVVGAGAKVLGAVTIGERSRIGANAVVVKDVPPDAVVVGVPGEIIRRGPHPVSRAPDLEHGRLPDVLGDALNDLVARVEKIEKTTGSKKSVSHHPTADHGVWHGEDFEI